MEYLFCGKFKCCGYDDDTNSELSILNQNIEIYNF